MYVMVLKAPLQLEQRQDPVSRLGSVPVEISACGVCRTDLHDVDGELPGVTHPIIPGHEVVRRVEALGQGTPLP